MLFWSYRVRSDSKLGLTDLFQYPFWSIVLVFIFWSFDFWLCTHLLYLQLSNCQKSKIWENRSTGHAKSSLNPDFLSPSVIKSSDIYIWKKKIVLCSPQGKKTICLWTKVLHRNIDGTITNRKKSPIIPRITICLKLLKYVKNKSLLKRNKHSRYQM